jgi:arylsulfatase A
MSKTKTRSIHSGYVFGQSANYHFMHKLLPLIFPLVLLYSCTPEQSTDRRPNIVYIFADDLGYGDLGCFGASDIATPNIDGMAKAGIKFTSLISASPVCSPSRAGLLTGRMPQRMGINGVFFPESFSGMSPEEITIAEVLRPLGYQTGIVGKWHLGHLEKYLPTNQGFDSYYGIPYSNDMESVVYLKNESVDSFRVNQSFTTQVYTQRALEFIDQAKEGPFFLYVAHNMPHVPIYASPQFVGTSRRGLYGDVIQEIDWSVGQILEKLREEDLEDNTLVIFSSDNGPWLVMEHHGGSAGGLREGKQFTFEGGMRVPTVAQWPAVITPASIHEDFVSQMDWFPTITNLCGATLPNELVIDGQDISAVLRGTGPRAGEPEFLYYDGATLEGFRRGDWKIKLPYPGFPGQPWKKAVAAHDTLLFDLQADPGEQKNLLAQFPEKAKELVRSMRARTAANGPLPPSQLLRSGADNSHYDSVRVYLAKQIGPGGLSEK